MTYKQKGDILRLFGASISVCVVAFVSYLHASEFIPLGDLPGGDFLSGAAAVSDNGTFIVGSGVTDFSDDVNPFLWTSSTGMVPLGPPSARFSAPNAVTDGGNLVVGTHRFELPDLYEQAFVWKSSTGLIPLSGLPAGAESTRANDVTPDGKFIVGASSIGISGTFDSEAFRLSNTGDLIGLGDLPGGQNYSEAKAISADGSVVVGQGSSASGNEAFVWTQSSAMTTLSGLAAITSGATNGSELFCIRRRRFPRAATWTDREIEVQPFCQPGDPSFLAQRQSASRR
jgi:probable HAF family extracellular repeat protein